MDHSQYDEELGSSEYLMPLSGEGSGPMSPLRTANEYTRPQRRSPKSSFDDEQLSTMDPPELQQRSERAPTNYAVNIPPVNYNENRSRQPARNAQAITFARGESSGSSSDAMEIFTKSVGHGLSDKSSRETLRKRLMFDGSIQNIPPSSAGHIQSHYANENQADFNGGGNSSQDGEIEQLVIWNFTLPLSLSR
jgi:hypothetical protein